MISTYASLLDSLVGVTWPARRALGAGAAGVHPSRLRGQTAEFTEYRPYRQGDDPRRLDWKLLARTDRAYLRITDDRATRTTVILLDASASMAFPEEGLGKWQQGCRLAVGLAAVARGRGDPTGLVVPRDTGVLRISPRTQRGVIGEMAGALDQTSPSGSAALAPGLDGVRPGGRVAIISDFLSDEAVLLRQVRRLLAGGVEVFALHVIAAEERSPSGSTRTAIDPEDPRTRRILHQEVRAEYAANFAAWRAALAAQWRQAGAEYSEVAAEADTAQSIRRIVRGARATAVP